MKKSIIALAFGTLGLGMAEFSMMGILPEIASSLGISIPMAGHFISAYALGVCVGAPLTVIIARHQPLKNILLGLVVLYILGNFCATIAPGYYTMLAARFISGFPHGAFFGVGSIVASRLAPEGKSSRAVALMTSGMTIANLAGVPLATFASHLLSWRLTFGFNATWGLLTLLLIGKWVPTLAPMPDNGIKGQFRFLKNKAPWLIILATMFGNGGIFCWYSYVNPMMTHVAGFSPDTVTLLMVLSGLSMCIGNILGGKLSDHYTPGEVAAGTQAIACVLLVSMFFFAEYKWMAVIIMCLTTGCLFALSSPQQVLLLQNSEGGEMMGAACVQIAFNFGNAVGAYVGGLPIKAGLGYQYTALPGAVSVLIGCLLLIAFTMKYQLKPAPFTIKNDSNKYSK